ncbi:MAG: glycerol kinase GlpK [Acetobacteraceae bacterium]|nr:glycerol kinase GlpK [Acetobacteraceae bacterium]
MLLALDQGTTSTRAIAYDGGLAPLAEHRIPLPQHFPAPGWVEHAPEDIAGHAVACLRAALAAAGAEPGKIAGIGITNQRETTLLWDRTTGRPLHRAICWQDRRTAAACERLLAEGLGPLIAERTGLLPDPYFSATKLAWLLDEVPGARAAAEAGRLAFGTVDCFLAWHLTGGEVHATDATNASRTMLFDIARGRWDEELLRAFRIPPALLPEVRDCAADYGSTTLLGGRIAIRGMAGDQQAAPLGQACFSPGMAKCTFGTGAFLLVNTGATRIASRSRLLSTIAWQFGGVRTYALEGAVFVAGAAVQWLRDGLGIIAEAAEATRLAPLADPAERVFLVPAFVGLGAPWWDAAARGAILGLTRGSGRAELCRAALESVAFQTCDLLDAIRADGVALDSAVLRVDGGLAASDWTMQALSDLSGLPVDRPAVAETTALGAAYLAAVGAGLLPAPGEGAASHWRLERRFAPRMAASEAAERRRGWADAVRRVRSG